MIIDEFLTARNMSRYRLSKLSGVPQATIADICSGKASLERCAAGTVYRIAGALGTTVETLLTMDREWREDEGDGRSDFDTFKSNVCHMVKDNGDMNYIIKTLEQDTVRVLYDKGWNRECLYVLAMLDYLCRVNDLPLCANYDDLRCQRLAEPYYPRSVLVYAAVMQDESIKEEARRNAIPEFMRFNIVEGEVRNIA